MSKLDLVSAILAASFSPSGESITVSVFPVNSPRVPRTFPSTVFPHDSTHTQVRRFVAGELMLSFVPDPEQRTWRMVTRGRLQVIREKVQVQNQIESLLEEGPVKLSSVISDLLSLSGRRILGAATSGAQQTFGIPHIRLSTFRRFIRLGLRQVHPHMRLQLHPYGQPATPGPPGCAVRFPNARRGSGVWRFHV